MCGRFTLKAKVRDLERFFAAMALVDLEPRYNIAPSQPVLVARARQRAEDRVLHYVSWGLVPRWANDPSIGSRMINARSETAAEKPAFRDAMRYRRCLIPADGFYEWKKLSVGRQPYHFRLLSGKPMAMAGLYESWAGPNGEQLDSCAILTTRANACVGRVHERMPVLVGAGDFDRWLDPGEQDAEAVADLLQPWPDGAMESHAVSRRVNRTSEQGEGLVAPVEPEGGLFD